MNDYLQYVHNLKGASQYDHFRPHTRDAIISLLLRQIDDYNSLEKTILNETGQDVLDFISRHLDLKKKFKSIILSTNASSYVEDVDFNDIQSIINLSKINHTRWPNKLFRSVNILLPVGGMYIGRIETYGDRKCIFLKKYGRTVGQLVWYADVLINRVVPRLYWLDKLYFRFTQDRMHCMAISELLGRLFYCGFEIVDFKTINGLTYFVAVKEKRPLNSNRSSYYPVIGLDRVGRNGELIRIFKLRTMHPYSEYIQGYMIRTNGYNDKGRPANDYRVAHWGKSFRKWYIDELPQLINVLRGEMKLVGLRPLSKIRFDEFPDDLKAERIKYKPGCIPPYVALNMPGDKECIEAERIYIYDLKKHPYTTDFRYMIKAIFNILFKKPMCS